MSNWSGSIPELLFTYVQENKPGNAVEGETWYDEDDNQAYVFTDDVGSTTEFTVTEHSALGGIGADDHHAQAHDNADHTTSYLPESNYNPEADTHSRPASTQNTGQATGQITGFTYPRFDASNAFNESGSLSMSYAVPIMAHANEVQLSNSGFGRDAVVHYADGTSDTFNVPEEGSVWHSTNGQIVTWIEWDYSNIQVTGVNLVEIHGHNHGI